MDENELNEIDENELNSYDFVVNEEDEVMLLLHAQESEPHNARFEVDMEEKSALLVRNENDEILLEGIDDNILDSLQDEDKLLICELKVGETDEDTQIVYAYEADLVI